MNVERDVFLCHSSEDKPTVLKSLSSALDAARITYWYDEAEIHWGDSITEKVNVGLRRSQYVLVVFSQAFAEKNWPQRELNAALNIEASTGKVKVLPLLVGSPEQRKIILKAYPILNDKAFVTWDSGVSSVIEALQVRLGRNASIFDHNTSANSPQVAGAVKHEEAILRIHKTAGLQSGTRQGLSLFHSSDLHFGRQFFHTGKEIGYSLSRLIENQIRKLSSEKDRFGITNLPSLIVISGDLTNEASDEQYREAMIFLDDLKSSLQKLDVKKPLAILAPGNHDLSWRLSLVEENNVVFNESKKRPVIKKLKNDEKKSFFPNIKWIPYIQNTSKVHKLVEEYEDAEWWYYNLKEKFEARIFVINSSHKITYLNNAPQITTDLIDKIEKKVGFDDSILSILVIHHPVSTWGDHKVQNDLTNYLHNRLGIRIILSGHKHSSKIIPHRLGNGKKILEIQTGRTAITPEKALKFPDLPNFRIVDIEKNTSGGWQRVKAWNFAYESNQFKPVVEINGSFYEKESL